MLKRHLRNMIPGVLGVCATLQFIRYYVVSTTFYLDMARYTSGRERLPFQERVLPVYLMWPIDHSSFVIRHLAHPDGGFDAASAASPQRLAFYIVSLVSFALAAFFVQRLYRAVTPSGTLSILVFPIFMVVTLWTYVVHIDANFSYPYDMPSLAFFAGGLLAIYQRQFTWLALVVFLGTFNRETTLFLIGLYVIDAASVELPEGLLRQGGVSLRQRFAWGKVPWQRALFLMVLWLMVKVFLAYHFRFNDNSENIVRLWGNVGRLRPRLWPILFNVCGYVLPIVVLLRSRMRPVRFANYLYILPLWIGVVFYTGVILETRTYGELCSYAAVAAVLLLEDAIASARAAEPHRSVLSGERVTP